MKKINELKENKIFKISIAVLRVIIVILLIGFVFSVCLQRFSKNKLSIFNYRMFTVVTGSMEPRYKVGDVLIAQEVDPSSIEVGDTISYLGKAVSFRDKVITHEVVDIDIDKTTGKRTFHTKGLTNAVEDPIVNEDQLYGKVIYKCLVISLIYKIVSTSIGFYIFIIVPILYIIISEIISTLLNKEEKRRKQTQGSD